MKRCTCCGTIEDHIGTHYDPQGWGLGLKTEELMERLNELADIDGAEHFTAEEARAYNGADE